MSKIQLESRKFQIIKQKEKLNRKLFNINEQLNPKWVVVLDKLKLPK